jgi:hypothetical protein
MKPHIDHTEFGSITIDGVTHEHDVLILPEGDVKKRQKKLSSAVYGTSHVISLAEARHIYEDSAHRLIVGSGQTGMVTLSAEAFAYFQQHGCRVDLLRTPDAIRAWNEAGDDAIGLFHVTC